MSRASRLRKRFSKRARLAGRYLSGAGIELGALHSPLPVPRSADVTYVDHLDVPGLRAHYPELAGHDLVPVDVIDDAQTLGTFESSSQDFVIASHVIEHCEDPVSALLNWIRVLRPGGVAFVAVPDKRSTFDSPRATSTWEHVLEDHRCGPERSRSEHYLEWARLVDGKVGDAAVAHARGLEEGRYSIHFHVWDPGAFREFAHRCLEVSRVRYSVEALVDRRGEILLVARRDERPPSMENED